ncbi:MAG: hypothetical protein MUF58_03100 [Arcicella sp.]|jgi:hypothetical protein|nr:hypothetical protein [Arcicella sp.]
MKSNSNTMTLGIILTILGVGLTIVGIIFITKNSDKVAESIEKIRQENEAISTEKQKGDDFEKFVIQKFSKSYFTIIEWTGDKYIDGMYPISNTNPDLMLRFKMKEVEKDFAVECKYRSNYYKNGVEWCTGKQLENYQNFATDREMPVFVAIGLGGVATAPEELFIIPLSEIKGVFLDKAFLERYKKENFKESNLFFDYERGVLK